MSFGNTAGRSVTGANTDLTMNDEQLAMACGLMLGVLMALFI